METNYPGTFCSVDCTYFCILEKPLAHDALDRLDRAQSHPWPNQHPNKGPHQPRHRGTHLQHPYVDT